MKELITSVIVTSPTASDPSTETIDATHGSVLAHDGLTSCRVLIGADGIRPEQRSLEDGYDEKIARVRDTRPVWRLPQWGHQANVTRGLLGEVHTPLVLFMEHDTPLLPAETCPIDWQGCAQTLIDGELDLIRFLHESRPLDEHRHLFLEASPADANDGATRRIPYVRTVQWSQRPHLARTSWYRDLVDTYFAPSSRCFLEDCLYGVVNYAWREHGLAGWNRFRLGVYADPEPTWQRTYHLDGRAGDPKGPQTFSYPGDTWPEGAPAPTLSRVFEG